MMPFSGQAFFCFDCEYSAQEVWGLGLRNFPVSSNGTICIANLWSELDVDMRLVYPTSVRAMSTSQPEIARTTEYLLMS